MINPQKSLLTRNCSEKRRERRNLHFLRNHAAYARIGLDPEKRWKYRTAARQNNLCDQIAPFLGRLEACAQGQHLQRAFPSGGEVYCLADVHLHTGESTGQEGYNGCKTGRRYSSVDEEC